MAKRRSRTRFTNGQADALTDWVGGVPDLSTCWAENFHQTHAMSRFGIDKRGWAIGRGCHSPFRLDFALAVAKIYPYKKTQSRNPPSAGCWNLLLLHVPQLPLSLSYLRNTIKPHQQPTRQREGRLSNCELLYCNRLTYTPQTPELPISPRSPPRHATAPGVL